MMNGAGFRSYQAMNMVHRTKEGTQIWLGDYYAATNVQGLKQKNIKSVLTSAAMLDVHYNKQHQINHKIINAYDIPSYKMTPHFEEAYMFISDALKRGNLLVHCAAGISRSTTFVLVYLMRAQGMPFQQALGYVRSKRNVVNPNYGFQNELKKYEHAIKNNTHQHLHQKPPPQHNQFKHRRPIFQFSYDQNRRPMPSQQKYPKTAGGKRSHIVQKVNSPFPPRVTFNRGKSVTYNSFNRMLGDNRNNMHSVNKDVNNFKFQVPKLVPVRR